MSASSWFVAAAVSGAACAVMAAVVVASGWRRNTAEVAILGGALSAVSLGATAMGLSGTSLAGGTPGSMWLATLLLPGCVAVAVPLLVPNTALGRRLIERWKLWVAGWYAAILAVASTLMFIDAAPPDEAAIVAAAIGLPGVTALALRQVFLYRVSRLPTALVAAAAVALIGVSTLGALSTEPGSRAAWTFLVLDNIGVLGGSLAILRGYRHGRAVADVLRPVLDREPLAALEVGLSPEIHAFVAALDRKDALTRDHVVRTSALAMRVAIRAGLSPDQVRQVAIGGLLHDIGKLIVPSEIINKPGRLTDEEFAIIKTHPEAGEKILLGAPGLAGAAAHVRSHHERVDGAGYPDGLMGDEIPLELGLVSVADAWDAMTHTRSYREGMTPELAAQILRDGAGQQWRADAVELLLAEVGAGGAAAPAGLDGLGRRGADQIAALESACSCDDVLTSSAS